jgi:tripartite-type tricarboxylate transporter receptor subunit TctC
MIKNKFLLILLFCVSTAVCSQTVRLIVPFSTGGIVDRSARLLEKNLSNQLPYNFVVETRTGAGGIIAANYVAKHHTKETVLLLHSSAIATNTFNPNSTYDLGKDFVTVAKLGFVPMALVVNPNSKVSSIKALKNLKEPTFYGSGGVGTATHVAGELLQLQINQELSPVVYNGEYAALTDVLSNNIPMMFASVSTVISHANSPQLSILATTGTQRNSALPDVPTFAEQGIRNFDRSPNWIVVLANPGADPMIVAKIRTALAESFASPQDQEVYRRTGLELNRQPISNVREFLLEEVEKIRPFHSKLKQ